MTYFSLALVCMAVLALLLIVFIWFVDNMMPNWIYKGPISENFDGRRFFFAGIPKRTLWQILRWLVTRKPTPWPVYRPLKKKFKPPLRRTQDDHPQVTFIGHASILIQWKQINILIDPVFADKLGPKYTSKFNIARVHEPGIHIDDLPPIDLILVSHSHYDHMDIETLQYLASKHQPLLITGLGNKKILAQAGIQKITEMDWWQKNNSLLGLEITYLPAVHSSNRSLFDIDFTLWGGFAIKMAPSGYIYFSSDSGDGPHWQQIKEKLGPPSLAILPIGAYEARWFMKRVHMNPQDMLKAFKELESPHSMAVHFGMFPLADEGIDEPTETLRLLMKEQELTENAIWIPLPGETRKFAF